MFNLQSVLQTGSFQQIHPGVSLYLRPRRLQTQTLSLFTFSQGCLQTHKAEAFISNCSVTVSAEETLNVTARVRQGHRYKMSFKSQLLHFYQPASPERWERTASSDLLRLNNSLRVNTALFCFTLQLLRRISPTQQDKPLS